MFNYHLDDQIGKDHLSSEPKNQYKEPEGKETSIDNESLSEEELLKLQDDPDPGHLEAEKIAEERRIAELQAKQDEAELEELRKNREEDHEDAVKTNRRF